MAATYVTELQVSVNESEESQLLARGFRKTTVNLNKGSGGNKVYLWYKKGGCDPITRIQFSFTHDMTTGLNATGFEKVEKDLNTGAGGKSIYLWYYKGSTEYDIPIVKVEVSVDDEAHKFASGWERSACDLNRDAGGDTIYLWIKREKPTFICDVVATDCFDGDEDFFQDGYIRVDEDINRGAGGAFVYIWFRLTTDSQKALSALKVSTNEEEYQRCQNQDFLAVNTDLNKGTKGSRVLLWFKKQNSCSGQIKNITVIIGKTLIPAYEGAGAQVIEENLNTGNHSVYDMYLCFTS